MEADLLPLSPMAPNCCDSGDSMVGDAFDDEKRAGVLRESMSSDHGSVYEQDGFPESRKGWQASNPWTLRIDGPRALMEFVRALIGYIL